jgi:nitroreductase
VDFSRLIRARYSCRDYSDQPVEDEKLELVLEAARLAPTAANRQPFRIVVVRDEELRQQMSDVYMRHWFYAAPVILCLCGVAGEAWVRKDHRHYTDVDVAIAMDHLILQATDLGLGTCWIADFDPEAARRLLHLPRGLDPLLLSPLGYPAAGAEPKEPGKRRRPLEELVHWDRYQDLKEL